MSTVTNIANARVREINREYELAQHDAETAVQHAIRCGELLLEQKAAMRHGEFMPWVAANCSFSYDNANRYMRACEKAKFGTLANFASIAALLAHTETVKKPQRKKQYLVDEILVAEGLVGVNPLHGIDGRSRQSARAEIAAIDSDPTLFEESRAADLARVCTMVREQRLAAGRVVHDVTPGVDREELPKSAQEKLDSALRRYQRELDTQHARRLLDLEKVICDEVDRRLPDHARQEIERAQRQVKQAEFLQRGWRNQMENCKPAVQLFYDTWRTLAQCLHPDRAPDDRRDQFSRANVQLNLLKVAFDKIDRETW